MNSSTDTLVSAEGEGEVLPFCFTSHYPTLTLIGNNQFISQVWFGRDCNRWGIPSLPLIWANELFAVFSLPWPVEKGTDFGVHLSSQGQTTTAAFNTS